MKKFSSLLSLLVVCSCQTPPTMTLSDEQALPPHVEALVSKMKKAARQTQPWQGQVDYGVAYNASLSHPSWATDYSTLYVGNSKLEPGTFRARLADHVDIVRGHFRGAGLKGYVFLATPEYEVAWQSWPSKEVADLAFRNAAPVLEDADEILEMEVFTDQIEPPTWLIPGSNF